MSVAVSFCKEKDVCNGACLVEVYFPKCWVSYAMYIMESVSYFGEEVFDRGVRCVICVFFFLSVAMERVHEFVPCVMGNCPAFVCV